MHREFFELMAEQFQGLAFPDVTLKTGFSQIPPSLVSLETRFSRNVPLKIPLVSAAMDTVTESEMAIAMAIHGGLGVIHRGLDPKRQAQEVARVKHHLHGVIERPITVRDTDTIEQILNRKRTKNYRFNTFPVIDGNGKLVGLMTETDFAFASDKSVTAAVAMTSFNELVYGSPGLSPQDAWEKMRQSGKKKVLPLIDPEGRLVGMYVFADVQRIISGDANAYNLDSKGRLRVAAAIGVLDDAYEHVPLLIKEGVDAVVVDVAHADTIDVKETCQCLKRDYSGVDVVLGNISDQDSVKRHIEWGADGVKIGQGPGSICTTRLVTGAGFPQFTAIGDCAIASMDSDDPVPIGGDGGIKYSGHITLALAAGASYVMVGSLLAGTDETPGETHKRGEIRVKRYRGMGSASAMAESRASRARYRQEDAPQGKTVPEGVEGDVPTRGPVSKVIAVLMGGLRSGMGMVGTVSVPDLQGKAHFKRLTPSAQGEGHPSGLLGMEATSNYPGGVS
ncbi:MAG: IMP dehydrogenase [Candidatus Liptonbacteria bacterium]|nr:IMP dehydrogenase [Candidatus Liptonbacteria bacterium]